LQVENAHKTPKPISIMTKLVRDARNISPDISSENVVVLPRTPTSEKQWPSVNNEHLIRANRALNLLQHHNEHFQWRSTHRKYFIEGREGVFTQQNHGFQLDEEGALVVQARSNMRVDGFKYIGDLGSESQRSRFFTRQSRVFIVISAIYGGLHLTAWNAYFPTPVEKWMWRAAGLAMASSPMVIWAVMLVQSFHHLIHDTTTKKPSVWASMVAIKWLQSCLDVLSDTTFMITFLIMMIMVTITYPIARVYVLAEAFASLRQVPNGTYDTVQWTGFIPHAG
jgi:hypothetical protein